MDPLRKIRLTHLRRLSALIIFCLVLAFVGLVTCPFIDWSEILFYDGEAHPDTLQSKAIFSVRETALQQITGTYPTLQRRFDEVWYGEARCDAGQRTADLCTGIRAKLGTNRLLYCTLVLVACCLAWPLYFFGRVFHAARWHTLSHSVEATVRVSGWGFKLTEDGIHYSWREWTRDPCPSIVLLCIALAWGTVAGLLAWPIGMDLFRIRVKQALDLTIIDSTKFPNTMLTVQNMIQGYDMFAGVLVLTLISIVAGVFARDVYRLLVHEEVLKHRRTARCKDGLCPAKGARRSPGDGFPSKGANSGSPPSKGSPTPLFTENPVAPRVAATASVELIMATLASSSRDGSPTRFDAGAGGPEPSQPPPARHDASEAHAIVGMPKPRTPPPAASAPAVGLPKPRTPAPPPPPPAAADTFRGDTPMGGTRRGLA